MKDMTTTASRLDRLMKFLDVLLQIGIVACFVGFIILAAAVIFDLQPHQFGSGFDTIDIADCLELTISPEYVPDRVTIIKIFTIEMVLTLVLLLVTRSSLKCIRSILLPMTQGQPFHNTVSTNLKRLACYSIAYCLVRNAIEGYSFALFANHYHLANLLRSDKILDVSIQYEFDLTFLVFSAMLILLSYVFRYGEQLQQLSDETL